MPSTEPSTASPIVRRLLPGATRNPYRSRVSTQPTVTTPTDKSIRGSASAAIAGLTLISTTPNEMGCDGRTSRRDQAVPPAKPAGSGPTATTRRTAAADRTHQAHAGVRPGRLRQDDTGLDLAGQ